jgi:small-conductance mechanosensitive channel
MERKQAAWFFLVACCCVLMLMVGRTALAQGDQAGLWHSIADGLRRNIAIKRQELARMKQALPEETAALGTALSSVSSRLDQLLLLRGVAGDTPWASRTLLMQLAGLSHAVVAARASLEDMQEALAHTKRDYATLRHIRAQNASREYADLINEELSGPGRDFKELKHEVDAVKDEVDGALAQATTLSADIQVVREDETKRFIAMFVSTYFASAGSLLRVSGLLGAADDIQEWFNSAPRFWGPMVGWMSWGAYFVSAAVAFALSLGLVFFLMRKSPEKRKANWPGLVWLAAGLALIVPRYIVAFAGNQFTTLLWVSVVSFGLVLLIRSGPVLMVLYACFQVGVGMDAVNLPASGVSLVWTAVAAIAVWRLSVAGSRRSPDLWVLLASGVASLLGYGPQSSMAVQALFMLHLTLAASGALERWLAGFAGGRKRSLAALAHPLVMTVLAAVYIAWVLSIMGGPGLVDYVFAKTVTVGRVVVSLDAVAGLCIVFFLLRLVLAWFQELLGMANFRGKSMDPGLAHTVGAAFSYLAWIGFIIFSLHMFEVPLGALTWIASGLSVGIGFGLKDIVNNFISGLIIMFGGAVKKGDIIQQGKNFGEVVDLSVRNTIMRTLDNTTVIIPNSSFLRGEIVNLSYQDASMRLTIPVTVAPGTKIKKVRKILLAIAKEHADVLKKPAPEVLLRSLGRAGLEFDLYVWIDNFLKKFQVQSELASAIDSQFQENKILVPFQGVKVKYKPKGTEEMQLEDMREELRQKRAGVFCKVRRLRRVHARRRWPVPLPVALEE